MPEVQLALVGSMASDDPEGWDFFNATIAHADGDPDIHILNNFNNVGAIEVNAFQSHSDVLIQKSTREGFGLTVSEAIWKARPFIGGNVGGIPLQIEDGVTGFLVSSVEQCAERTLEILRDPELGTHARPARQGARAPALPHAALPARLSEDLQRARRGMTGEPAQRAPLVLVSNRGPVTFHARRRGPARLGRAGDGADGPGLPPRRDLDRLGDERVRRRGLARTRRSRVPGALPRRRRVPGAPGGQRPGGLRPLLQRVRQPDAVVHPALPVGSVERAGHPPRGDRGVRVRLQRRQRGSRAGGRRGARGRGASRW